MNSSFEFLNVDLDIESRFSLDPLLSELGDRVHVLHSESKPNKHFVVMEICRLWKVPSPDKTIAALCDVVESISPNARKIWKQARRKIFNVGLDIDSKASHLCISISDRSLHRIADLGGSVAFTCYNHSNFRKL